MRIQAKCQTCGRNFLLSQIGPDADEPGRCPFCGVRFAKHYSSVLSESVRDAEASGARFAHAIGRLRSMQTGFDIDIEGFLRDLNRQVEGPGARAG